MKDILPFRLEPYVWPHSSYNCEIKLLMMLWGIEGDKNYIVIDVLKIVIRLMVVFCLSFLLNMRHALAKIGCVKIGQGRTPINPSKWNHLLPALIQLWHLDHVILLAFCVLFPPCRSSYWLHDIKKTKQNKKIIESVRLEKRICTADFRSLWSFSFPTYWLKQIRKKAQLVLFHQKKLLLGLLLIY